MSDISYIDTIEFTVFTNSDVVKNSSIKEEEGINVAEIYDNGIP